MGLLVLELTDSPSQVALLFVFRWSPMLLIALPSGMLADRANRWQLMVAVRTLIVAVIGTLAVLVATDSVQPWHLLLGSLLMGWLYVFEFPSRRSFIYELVGGHQIVGAMSLETITVTIGRFLGPLLGGYIVQFQGYPLAFILLTILYGLAWILTLLVSSRFPARSTGSFNFLATAASGIRYAWGNRIIRAVLGFTMIMNSLAFSVESLFPVVARDHLGVSEGLTGLLIAAQSIGTFVAAIGIGILSGSTYHGRIFCAGLFIQLVSLVLFAFSPWYPVSFILLLFAGIGSAGFGTMQSTIIMITAPSEVRGVSLGVLGHCIGVSAVGAVIVGQLAERVDANIAVGMSTGLGLFLLITLIPFTPLVKRPITPPEEPATAPDGTAAARAA
jgi:predicted MFS family arabinose efflux permease